MNILILSGSSRQLSHTLGLAKSIQIEIQKQGEEAELIDLVELDLPPANPEFHNNPLMHPNHKVVDLAKSLDSADAVILLSPVYHNSYSGTLKNALDSVSIAQFRDKPMALGSNGGDRTSQVVDHLRIVARGLNAFAIPTQVCVAQGDFIEGSDGFVLNNPDILDRVERLVVELILITQKLKA